MKFLSIYISIYISMKLEEILWLWAEVKVWNHMMIYMKGGRKMFWRSKDLDFLISIKKYSREIMGLSQSKDLDFNGYIREISRKMLGLGQSKDLRVFDKVQIWICLSPYRKRPEKSWVWAKVKIWIFK